MRHKDQVAEAHKLLSYLDTRATALADGVYRNPVSDYTARGRPRSSARCSFGAVRSISGSAAYCRTRAT
jgi:hypothetical protein